jgi:hypothetical protein
MCSAPRRSRDSARQASSALTSATRSGARKEVEKLDDLLHGRATYENIEELLRAATADADLMKELVKRKGCTTDVNRSLVVALIEYFGEADLGCDHAVGMCTEGGSSIHTELQLLLEGKQICPECGGGGMAWSEEARDAAVREAEKNVSMAPEEIYDLQRTAALITCPTCAGAGEAPFPGEGD